MARAATASVLLFVCTSNTCRSPMAECMAKKWFHDQDLHTFGTIASIALSDQYEPPGSPAAGFAIRAMERRGLNLTSHRSRLVKRSIVDSADVIVCVTARHKQRLLDMFPDLSAQVVVFPQDIEDPYQQDEDVYETCAYQLWNGLLEILPSLTKDR